MTTIMKSCNRAALLTARRMRPTYGIQSRRLLGTINAKSSSPLVLHSANPRVGVKNVLNQRRTLFIQTEETPNPDALKFIPSMRLLPEGNTSTREFLSGREAYSSPLARKLFTLDGVKTVMFGPDFITVQRDPDEPWSVLKPEIFSIITEHLAAGLAVFEEGAVANQDTQIQQGDSEVVSMIKELIDTRIRPAIQEDGGDIEYRGFDEDTGTVKLQLRGACRTCDSSSVTLRNGIEAMLKHYVEEVQNVEQVLSPEEEIATSEFENFEKHLKDKKQLEH